MELIFERANTSDISAIYQQSCELVRTYEDAELLNIEKVLHWLAEKIEKNISDYTRVTKDGIVVAYYRFIMEEESAELDDLYVMPEFRGCGIGSAILSKCRNETSLPIVLYVFNRNTGAISLYQRHGYVFDKKVSPTRSLMVNRT